MKDRTYVNSTAEKLCLKLEALEVAKIAISPLKLLAVQAEVKNTEKEGETGLVPVIPLMAPPSLEDKQN